MYSRAKVQAPAAIPVREAAAVTAAPLPTARPTQKPGPVPTAETTQEPAEASVNEIRPEVRAFLDAYEGCMDEYVEFMQKYLSAESGDMIAMMSDYYRILARYTEFTEKMDAFNDSELNHAKLAYYIEVTGRVSQKLLTVSYG